MASRRGLLSRLAPPMLAGRSTAGAAAAVAPPLAPGAPAGARAYIRAPVKNNNVRAHSGVWWAGAGPWREGPRRRRRRQSLPSPLNSQLAKALRDITRVLLADKAPAAWRRGQTFTRPAIERVQAAKASAARLERSAFKRSMRWVMSRRERGF
jgi:hypothetical protein